MLFAFHLMLPAGRRRLGAVWPGVLFTLIAWGAMAGIYGYYLRWFPTFAKTYAGLSGIVAALFFLYLAAIVLIFGGELNRVLMLRREARDLRAMIRKQRSAGQRQAQRPGGGATHRLDDVIEGSEAGARRGDQNRHVAGPMLVLPHLHMGLGISRQE